MARSVLVALVVACATLPAVAQPAPGLTPFASDSALTEYLHALLAPPPPRPRPAPVAPSPPARGCAGAAAAVVAGRVVDAEAGLPIPGANVVRVGTPACGAATDPDGRFRLGVDSAAVAAGAVRLAVRFIGYEAAETEVALGTGDSLWVEVALEQGGSALEEVVVTGQAVSAQANAVAASADAVTNVQTAGVDEGGIVKLYGDYLVVLRRGRLFTVAVGDGRLDPVDVADAFGPLDPSGTWYDELLIVGETAVVVGYSYRRGGTELVLHDIGRDGRLSYRSTYHLRSNDYYSAENYASRVVDGRLVFYTPLGLRWRGPDRLGDGLPAMRRWEGDAQNAFEPIASATRVYRPARELERSGAALHTVTSCAIADGALDCEATAVLGPWGHTFYVSREAVYVWLSRWGRAPEAAPGVLYRLPLDGSRPSALGVAGGPIDQFSFLERDGVLNVVVSNVGWGQWMWRSERARHRLALARIPLDALGDGADDAPEAWYHPLPVPFEGVDVNRFVGDHLLYGSSRTDGDEGRVQVAAYADPRAVLTLPTGHATERVEVMGAHAVVVGSERGALRFSAVRLGARPRLAGTARLRGLAQGETRSHGFYYRSEGDERGVLGLPVRRFGGRYASLRHGSASVVYLRNRGLRLRTAGALDASPEPVEDACQASCVDWYGNARPLFVGDRVFALLGYEVVEGRMWAGRLEEVGRASFAPGRFQTMR